MPRGGYRLRSHPRATSSSCRRRMELFGQFSGFPTVADGIPSTSTVPEHLPRGKATLSILEAIRRRSTVPISGPEDAIRAELFSIERLEQHAESLAAAQRVTPRPVAGRPLADAAARQRQGSAGRLSRHRLGDPRQPSDHAGRRMAARQFSPRRRADPRDPARSAAGLLSPAAQAERRGRWPAIRASSAWPGPSSPIPTAVSTRRCCCRFVARLSARPAAHDRRALGGRDHAAHRAGGESPPLGAADRGRARGPPGRRPVDDRLLGVDGAEAEPATAVFGNLGSMPLPAAFAVQLVQRLRDQDPETTPALRWLDERLARRARPPTKSSARSISARARRTSRCATSSPACA